MEKVGNNNRMEAEGVAAVEGGMAAPASLAEVMQMFIEDWEAEQAEEQR